jgi:hypothetical protein
MNKLLLVLVASAVLLVGCGQESEQKLEQKPASATEVVTEIPSKPAGEESQTMTFTVEQIGQALLDGKYDAVYDQTSEAFKNNVTSAQFREAVVGFSEGVTSWKPNSQLPLNGADYNTWMDQSSKKGLIVSMDEEGIINGLQLKPLESFPESDHDQTQHAYELPFNGEWYVFWGGEDVLANYHYEHASQRYAYDIVQVQDGYSYHGDSTKNESYYAFGQEVLTPLGGKVVHVVNDLKDNEPVGVMNEEHPAGNLVVIDHGNGEYSFLAHLQEGSVTVKVGDEVSTGDLLGLCGNSGNSSEAHLHYQVSDNKDLFEGTSLRVQWEGGLKFRQGEAIHSK